MKKEQFFGVLICKYQASQCYKTLMTVKNLKYLWNDYIATASTANHLLIGSSVSIYSDANTTFFYQALRLKIYN